MACFSWLAMLAKLAGCNRLLGLPFAGLVWFVTLLAISEPVVVTPDMKVLEDRTAGYVQDTLPNVGFEVVDIENTPSETPAVESAAVENTGKSAPVAEAVGAGAVGDEVRQDERELTSSDVLSVIAQPEPEVRPAEEPELSDLAKTVFSDPVMALKLGNQPVSIVVDRFGALIRQQR